jgi:hypothetical protein
MGAQTWEIALQTSCAGRWPHHRKSGEPADADEPPVPGKVSQQACAYIGCEHVQRSDDTQGKYLLPEKIVRAKAKYPSPRRPLLARGHWKKERRTERSWNVSIFLRGEQAEQNFCWILFYHSSLFTESEKEPKLPHLIIVFTDMMLLFTRIDDLSEHCRLSMMLNVVHMGHNIELVAGA